MDALKEARLTKAVDDLLARVESLEAGEQDLVGELDLQRELIRELNFRILFAMRYFQFGKTVESGVLDEFGKPVTRTEKITLWDIYGTSRDKFIAGVEADAAKQNRAPEHEGGSDPAPVAADGQGVDATQPANADSGARRVLPGDFSVKH